MKKKRVIGVVDFIHPEDSAINTDVDPDTGKKFSDIEKYREEWDFEKHCVLKHDVVPTLFKINFAVTYKKQIAIKNSQLGGFGKGEETGFKLGNHSNQVVRSVLIDIINPPGMDKKDEVVFKREGADLVSEATMRELEEMGVVDDIYSFWMAKKTDTDDLKKS